MDSSAPRQVGPSATAQGRRGGESRYEGTKACLANEHPADRAAYTSGKDNLVARLTPRPVVNRVAAGGEVNATP